MRLGGSSFPLKYRNSSVQIGSLWNQEHIEPNSALPNGLHWQWWNFPTTSIPWKLKRPCNNCVRYEPPVCFIVSVARRKGEWIAIYKCSLIDDCAMSTSLARVQSSMNNISSWVVKGAHRIYGPVSPFQIASHQLLYVYIILLRVIWWSSGWRFWWCTVVS